MATGSWGEQSQKQRQIAMAEQALARRKDRADRVTAGNPVELLLAPSKKSGK
jgi:hypothetical protein